MAPTPGKVHRQLLRQTGPTEIWETMELPMAQLQCYVNHMVLVLLIWIEIHQVGCFLYAKSTKKCNIVLVIVHTALVTPRLKCHSQNWQCSPATNLDVTPNAIPMLWEAVFEFWQISHCSSYIAFLVRNEIQETKRPQRNWSWEQQWPRVIKYMSLSKELQWRSSWHLTAPLSLYEC